MNDLFRVPPCHSDASSSPLHSFVVNLHRASCGTFNICFEIHEPVFQPFLGGLVRAIQANRLRPTLTHKIGLRRRLFKHKPHHDPLLLLYRDNPCVVIGRNQNAWKEVNMTELRKVGIPFIRRRSGGGTVYHVGFPFTLPSTLSAKSGSSRILGIQISQSTSRELHSTGTIPQGSYYELSNLSVWKART